MGVILYSRPKCDWCTTARSWLKKKRIKFEERDVAESQNSQFRDELLEKSSQLGVPMFDINGTIIVGFHEKEIEKAL